MTAKKKKLLAKAEKLEKAAKEQRQLDAVNAQTPSGSGQKVCLNMRDRGSCKHGDKCRFSHDKSQVEAARKAKKEAERGRSTDVGAAGSGQRRPSSQGQGAGKDKKSLPELEEGLLEGRQVRIQPQAEGPA